MNITLRKASAVQNTILDAIKAIKIAHTVELNEFQNPETEIKRANDELVKNDQRRASLLTAYYNIRGLVAQANSAAGIDLLLTKAAFIDKRVVQVEELAGATAMTELEVVKGKIEKIKTRPADARSSIYGYNDTVSTSVLAQAQIDQAKKQISDLKKQNQKNNDDVIEV
jgi:hypothetical protein